MDRVGDFKLTWGESVRWDDQRQRLYFVDCAAQTLHWLEGGQPPLRTLPLPSMPTGLVITDEGTLVACLDDGLHLVDPDVGTVEHIAPYPVGMHGRANDANADGSGNLVTGTLNIGPGPGALWWFSSRLGWRLLDDEFGNANGPTVLDVAGRSTLVCGDTVARAVYAYGYDGAVGAASAKRVLSDHAVLDGAPDGATVDRDGGVWSCVLRSGKLARITEAGTERVVDMPMANPSDVTFGGPELDILYVTSIALDLGEGTAPTPEAGTLLALDDTGAVGRQEPRFRL